MDFSKDLEKIKQDIEQAKEIEPKQELQVVQNQDKQIGNVTRATEFTNAIDTAKIETIKRASAEDEKFKGKNESI